MPRGECESCREDIDLEAEQCPHCNEKRMTAKRYKQYLYLYLPAVALGAGGVLFLIFDSASPLVTFNWFWGFTILAYLVGLASARSKRKTVRERVQQNAESGDTT